MSKLRGFLLVFAILYMSAAKQPKVCEIRDFFLYSAVAKSNSRGQNIYILYDVNPVEGFNLRRDVYIRLAVFLKNLKIKKEFANVQLVLPPFRHLYHWRSSNTLQNNLFWNHFFDMSSLRNFTTVLDFFEFIDEIRLTLDSNILRLDNVFKLIHFENIFTDGVFVDKYEYTNCNDQSNSPALYFQYDNITEKDCTCVKFQGGAKLLEGIVKDTYKQANEPYKTFLFSNAEIVLHDHWGNNQFWEARRSMRFNKRLIEIANNFRKKHFNSTDNKDNVQRPDNWKDEKPYRGARGGEYICAHIRRGDFLFGRETVLPTLRSSAAQIKIKLMEYNLNKVFISSDCSVFEFKNLKSYLGRVKINRFAPDSLEEKIEIKDGGRAIVDQIICSHARYFLGTYESTFTYRIYEEREILGFPTETTFNTLCKNEDMSNCERNSVWPIVY